jgi:hypothetical protein
MCERGRLTTWAEICKFTIAGNATFTLVSKRTGTRFTFKVTVAKDADTKFFVGLLNGPDNNADYVYMAMLYALSNGQHQLVFTRGSKVTRDAVSARAFQWFVDMMNCARGAALALLEFWHEGRCGRCGRKLTVPESVAAGIGPECAGRML